MFEILAAALAIAGDQLFKGYIVRTFAEGASRPLLPGVVQLTYVRNKGASFGMLQGMGWLFFVVAVAFAGVVIWALVTKRLRRPFARWTAAAVMAGALGNAIDRVARGFVVDMFELQFIQFGIFNIADVFITVGGALFCLWLLWCELHTTKKGKTDENSDDKG